MALREPSKPIACRLSVTGPSLKRSDVRPGQFTGLEWLEWVAAATTVHHDRKPRAVGLMAVVGSSERNGR